MSIMTHKFGAIVLSFKYKTINNIPLFTKMYYNTIYQLNISKYMNITKPTNFLNRNIGQPKSIKNIKVLQYVIADPK